MRNLLLAAKHAFKSECVRTEMIITWYDAGDNRGEPERAPH